MVYSDDYKKVAVSCGHSARNVTEALKWEDKK